MKKANRIKMLLAKANLKMLSQVQPLINTNIRNAIFDDRGYLCNQLEDKLLTLLKAKIKDREIIEILGIKISQHNSEITVCYSYGYGYKQNNTEDNIGVMVIDIKEILSLKIASTFGL